LKKILHKQLTANLLIFFLLIFPLGQLTYIDIAVSNVKIYWHDLIITIIFLMHIPYFLSQLDKKLRWLLGFAVFGIFSLIFNLSNFSLLEIFVSSLYLLRIVVYFAVIVLLSQMRLKKENITKIRFYIKISLFIALFLSFWQYIFFPRLEPIFSLGWDRHAYRLVGPWFDAGFTGIIFVLFSLWMVKKLITKISSFKSIFSPSVLLDIFIILASVVAILLSYSRISYLALFFGLGLFVWQYFPKKGKQYLVFFYLIFAFSLPFLPQHFGEGTKLLRTSTLVARVNNLQQGWEFFLKQPVFGYGLSTLRYLRRHLGMLNPSLIRNNSASGVDNSLLFLLDTMGILGTLAFLLFILQLKRLFRSSLFIVLLFAVGIHGMATNSWFYPWVILLLGILWWEDSLSENKIL